MKDTDDNKKIPTSTYATGIVNYQGITNYGAQDDDDRDAAQQDCDCWKEHALNTPSYRRGFTCPCDCHAPMLLKIGEATQPWAMRYVCMFCAEGAHHDCDGASCECRLCGYDDN